MEQVYDDNFYKKFNRDRQEELKKKVERFIKRWLTYVDELENNHYHENIEDFDNKQLRMIQEEYCRMQSLGDELIEYNQIKEQIKDFDASYDNQVQEIIERAMIGCIKKGYNEPAVKILHLLCDAKFSTELKDFDFITSNLQEIMKNYAKRENQTVLPYVKFATQIPFETDKTHFEHLILSGYYGDEFANPEFLEQLCKSCEVCSQM